MEIADKIVFVGSGNMAQAIISGILKVGAVKPKNIVCNDIYKEKIEELSKKFGIVAASDKKLALDGAGIIFLSVKPQNIKTLLDEIKPFIPAKTLVISIVAGTKTETIEKALQNIPVIRVMPNTPALLLAGAAVLCAGKYVSPADMEKTKNLFLSVGTVKIADESKFDAVTALSGSGPAYVFYLCRLMAKAGQKLGLDKDTAQVLAIQTVYGAGIMLAKSGISPDELTQKVKSPNGTTEAALKSFESQNLENIVYEAMKAASTRSEELSQ
ncbi:MAG: pyrroline-5-carboxylate reductase [Elusimicrobiota bacterium]|jgi:pyrroline-5-carboxylate reductase|nr:pyrroline-5-carboxylate reductase [Elusimicrobiota bacterium]